MTEEKNTVPTITRKDVTPLETPLMMTAMRYGLPPPLTVRKLRIWDSFLAVRSAPGLGHKWNSWGNVLKCRRWAKTRCTESRFAALLTEGVVAFYT